MQIAATRCSPGASSDRGTNIWFLVLADDRPSRYDGESRRWGTFEITDVAERTALARRVGAGHARDDDEDPKRQETAIVAQRRRHNGLAPIRDGRSN